MEWIKDRKWFSEHVRDLACRNLGTLGGGNHFIEIQAGDDKHVWLMIHSGSRHLGNVIARFYNGIVYDRWSKVKRGKTKGMYDLSEAPQAYKNIDAVIEAERDLIKPIVKLKPLGVVKG